MGVLQKIFGKTKLYQKYQHFKELGGFVAIFRPFGTEIYRSDLVRACIRPLAENTSKANPHSSDKSLERLLTYAPNPFMNGKDFLATATSSQGTTSSRIALDSKVNFTNRPFWYSTAS